MEVTLSGIDQIILNLEISTIPIGNDIIPVSAMAKSLGVVLDGFLFMKDQVSGIVKAINFDILMLFRITEISCQDI